MALVLPGNNLLKARFCDFLLPPDIWNSIRLLNRDWHNFVTKQLRLRYLYLQNCAVPKFIRIMPTTNYVRVHLEQVTGTPSSVLNLVLDILQDSRHSIEYFVFVFGTETPLSSNCSFLPAVWLQHYPRLRHWTFVCDIQVPHPLPLRPEELDHLGLTQEGWRSLEHRLRDRPRRPGQVRELIVRRPSYDAEKQGVRLLLPLDINQVRCGTESSLQAVLVYVGAFSILREFRGASVSVAQTDTTSVHPDDMAHAAALSRLLSTETGIPWCFRPNPTHRPIVNEFHNRFLTQDYMLDLLIEVDSSLSQSDSISLMVSNWLRDRFFPWSLVPKGWICGKYQRVSLLSLQHVPPRRPNEMCTSNPRN
eukprot:Gregarina_sp_Poly_1__85@NODE_1019_length_5335_cov_515_001708_g710_i0_p2_GENE_NODE_1019_length_5335_cov_515_001708_g710_i0NODE_1019_length_5335_cov_515_001708_g710_i0_p2_ORF_typecomplete_len363_score16_30_NODE_1019_length_5335_cov_515_001708_g710_i040755163